MRDDPAAPGGGRLHAAMRLTLLFGAHAVGTTNIMSIMAFAPAIQRDFGLSPVSFGLLISAYYGAQPLVALPGGWLVDRIGVRPAIAIAMACVSLWAMLLSMAEGGVMAASLLILAGIAYSLVNPATSVGVVTWFTPGWRSTMMSVKQAGVPLGGIFAALIAAVVGGEGWRVAVGLVAAVALLTAIGALLTPVAPTSDQPMPRAGASSLMSVIGNRRLLRICLATVLLNTAQACFFAYLVLYLVGPVGLSPAAAAAVFGTTHAVSAASRIVWGLLSDRLWRGDTRTCLRIIAFSAGLGFIGLALGQLLGAPAVVVAAVLLGGTIAGFAGVAQGAAAAEAPRHQIGAAMGIFMVITPFGSILGPPIFGGMIGFSEGYLLPYLALSVLTLAVGVFVLGRRR